MHLGLVAVVVSEYDPAISFFVDALGFELAEDSPAVSNDGRPKRWVVVRPPGAVTGLLLARADGEDQASVVGRQAAGRVGFFLHVDDFDAAYKRMASAGVQFITEPRTEPYGRVTVFLDIAGNKWDLIGPAPRAGTTRLWSRSAPFARREGRKVRHELMPDDEAAPEQSLAGGYVSEVVRVGGTVRRDPGPNVGFVRELLRLLELADFGGAPRYLGTDARGREILTFIDGHVPWQADQQLSARTDASLAAAAVLLRRYHDLTAGTALAGGSEVVCHNDLSPRNTVYRDRGDGLRPVAFIDWDLAAPGKRMHDVAYMCWQYPSLGTDVTNVEEAARQVRLIYDAYQLADRRPLIDTILWWQDRCWRGIEADAATGDAAANRLVAAGAPDWVRRERAWVAANRTALAAALA